MYLGFQTLRCKIIDKLIVFMVEKKLLIYMYIQIAAWLYWDVLCLENSSVN